MRGGLLARTGADVTRGFVCSGDLRWESATTRGDPTLVPEGKETLRHVLKMRGGATEL